jgi:hypothetical protein
MFNFGGITHVIKNPAGSLSLVGSVQTAMMTQRKPTVEDIMAGRTQKDGFAYVGKAYQSIQEIQDAAAACGAHLCDMSKCACRSLF